MGILSRQISELQRLKSNRIDRIATFVVSQNQETIIQTLQYQLHQGKVGEKQKTAPYYADSTHETYSQDPAKRPRQSIYGDTKKQGPYNFEWFGEFFESMTLSVEKEDFFIESNADTLDDLLTLDKMKDKFTKEDVLTMGEKNEKDLVEKLIEPELYNEILAELARIVR